MAAPLRVTPPPLALIVALPYLLSIVVAAGFALRDGVDVAAWRELWADPQTLRSLRLSVATAFGSSALALAATLLLVTQVHGTPAWQRLTRALGPMLALPHAAFAIGFALLVMPSGLLARLVAPLAGWQSPPDWTTVNDRWGTALIVVLALKETPFLLWNAAALFARPEVDATLRQQIAIGRTLGYGRGEVWWRVLWPQWLPRLAWPLVAVFAYSLTVVDVALIVGPGAPPTLGVLTWQWLTDANVERNAQGAAAALLLTLLLGALVLVSWIAARGLGLGWLSFVRRGRRGARPARAFAIAALAAPALSAIYGAVFALLVVTSFVGVWAFPALWPQVWTAGAWQQVGQALPVLAFTAGLAMAAAATALVIAVVWLEAAPPRWDAASLPFVVLPIVLPSLLLSAGLYRAALEANVGSTIVALWWVHALMSLPYLVLALAPAWRSFDRRYEWTALALGRSHVAFWWRIKAPLLAAPMAAAFAIGFAVSIAQYLPTQFVGAGRHATVTTEAVTLAAGGQRQLSAAWALLQALLPALGFVLAHRAAVRTTGMIAGHEPGPR